MKCNTTSAIRLIVAAGIIWLGAIFPPHLLAHCDTVEGSVVSEAKAALEKGGVTPVLKWVTKDNEKDESVAGGRGYVAAYVEYVHFAETLYDTIATKETHHGHTK